MQMFKNFGKKFKVSSIYTLKFTGTYLLIASILGLLATYTPIPNGLIYILYIVAFLGTHGYFTYRQKNDLLKLDEKPTIGKYDFIKNYIYLRILSFWAIIGIVAFFFIYQNDIKPAQMEGYQLYNKTTGNSVYFQSMIHIGKDKFYKDINNKVENYSNSGYVLYFEGVSDDGTSVAGADAGDALQGKIGIKISSDLYDNLSSSIGADIRGQDNDEMISKAKKVVNADVSIQELLGAVTGSGTNNTMSGTQTNSGIVVKQDQQSTETSESAGSGTNDILADTIKAIGEKQTFSFMFRGMLNFTMKNPEISNLALKVQGNNGNFFQERILNYRNTKLAEKVLSGGDQKVFITYGMAHFPGFFEELNKLSLSKGQGTYELISTDYNKPF